MNIKTKVLSDVIRKITGISKTGKEYTINQQEIIVELNGEVRKININLPNSKSAYEVGDYEINPMNLLSIGRFGFEIDRFKEIILMRVVIDSSLNKDTKPPLFNSKVA